MPSVQDVTLEPVRLGVFFNFCDRAFATLRTPLDRRPRIWITSHLAPLAVRGRRVAPGEGTIRESQCVESPPHRNPLFASGEREKKPRPFDTHCSQSRDGLQHPLQMLGNLSSPSLPRSLTAARAAARRDLAVANRVRCILTARCTGTVR